MMAKRVSVIIPTYKRYEDPLLTLQSLNTQTILPDEVIIFDESPDDRLRQILKVVNMGYPVRYVWAPSKFPSLARVRNKSTRLAKGDIIVFLDDDVILHSEYLKNMLSFLEDHPEVLGVTGCITNIRLPRLYRMFSSLFLLFRQTKRPKVQRSFIPTMSSCKEHVPTQWLSGCNMAYRRKVLEKFDFDWKLLKYSYSEDVDFSYQIYKKYGSNSLYLVRGSLLIHKKSPSGRLLGYSLEAHRCVTNLYMLYKHFGDTKLNILVFLWRNSGEILTHFVSGIIHKDLKTEIRNILTILRAIKFALKNLTRIKKGDIIELQKYH
ncbi:glycosyltransferase family 2 protein [Archaeoglobus neptunius]|uniref:glycosyltransferase family 2 protein n=1 Tax=Archaeoglobus neptunius TaxID=2798580 RepID=UPI001929643C|nr:glycosyltransferase family 2 protein [Archaeoglobus neptunius]